MEPTGLTPEAFEFSEHPSEPTHALPGLATQSLAASASQTAWEGVAHPLHTAEDFEALRRQLRYTWIELNKLWVEIQACPVFLNTDQSYSVQKVEQLTSWLRDCPAWNETIKKSGVIPELSNPATRKRLLGFVRDLMSARALLAMLAEKLDGQPSSEVLGRCQAIVAAHDLGSWTASDLEPGIEAAAGKLRQVRRIDDFFSALCIDTSLPAPGNAIDAGRMLVLLDQARSIQPEVRAWRATPVLGAGTRSLIARFQDQARPLIKARNELATVFKLEKSITPTELRRLAGDLRTPGILHPFRKAFRQARRDHQTLLVDLKTLSGITRLQKAERLDRWAEYLESVEAFSSSAEAQALFAPNFSGIDTDFTTALAANSWADSIRGAFPSGEPRSQERLALFLLQAPEAEIDFAAAHGATDEARGIRALLKDPSLDQNEALKSIIRRRESDLAALEQLTSMITDLAFRPEIALSEIEELKPMAEELEFLIRRMAGSAKLSPHLKQVYSGLDTKTEEIELCLDYVKFINVAEIPATLKTALLAAPGPIRLADTREMVLQSIRAMAAAQEQLRKLESMSHGQTRSFVDGKSIQEIPIPVALERIQEILRAAPPSGREPAPFEDEATAF